MISMAYDLTMEPTFRTVEALARQNERIGRSPSAKPSLSDRTLPRHCVVLGRWRLVHLEDIVLHDARLDIRTPTHELTIAHSIPRARRQISAHPPGWALSAAGIASLGGGSAR